MRREKRRRGRGEEGRGGEGRRRERRGGEGGERKGGEGKKEGREGGQKKGREGGRTEGRNRGRKKGNPSRGKETPQRSFPLTLRAVLGESGPFCPCLEDSQPVGVFKSPSLPLFAWQNLNLI